MAEPEGIVRGLRAGAKVAGRSASGLLKLIEGGRLPARREGEGYVFETGDLEALRRDRAPDPGDARDEDAHGRSEGDEEAGADDPNTDDTIGNGEPAEPARAGSPGTLDGELAARLFSAFAGGRTPVDVVVELKLSPSVVAGAYADWKRLGGVLPPETPPPAPAEVPPAALDALTARLDALTTEMRLMSMALASLISGLEGEAERRGDLAAAVKAQGVALGRQIVEAGKAMPWAIPAGQLGARVGDVEHAFGARLVAIEQVLAGWVAAAQGEAWRRRRASSG